MCDVCERTSTLLQSVSRFLVLLLVHCSLADAQPATPAGPQRVRAHSSPASAGGITAPVRVAAPRRAGPLWAAAKGVQPRYVALNPADPLDPYIAAQAAVLQNDPNRIFTFVRDQ